MEDLPQEEKAVITISSGTKERERARDEVKENKGTRRNETWKCIFSRSLYSARTNLNFDWQLHPWSGLGS